MQNGRFAENIRFACSQKHSISQVCREIGLNRQQFNRYINGNARPSAYNLNQIARYFGLQSTDFDVTPAVFRSKFTGERLGSVQKRAVDQGFPGDLKALRRYLGYYQTYHVSLSWPGAIVCSCTHLFEHDGQVYSKAVERIRHVEWEIRQLAKYNGQVAFLRGRIFLIERAANEEPMFSQTTLLPFPAHQRTYLKGICTGISWRNQNMPYATRMIWRYLGSDTDKRAMLSRCGILSPNSRLLSPTIRRFLAGTEDDQPTLILPQ